MRYFLRGVPAFFSVGLFGGFSRKYDGVGGDVDGLEGADAVFYAAVRVGFVVAKVAV